VFSEVKVSHIIEELPYWQDALLEWIRSCDGRLILKSPVSDGFELPLLHHFLDLSIPGRRSVMECRKLRFHYWIINPKIISKIFNQNGFEVNIVVKAYPILQIKERKGQLLQSFEKYKRIKI